MAKYLDQAGLQILWDQIKSKFIDNDELATFLANYETISDLQRDYANRTELTTILSGYATDEELASAISGLADVYVKKTVAGTNGTAYIFNESDGGGAKFVHSDGLESFVGVNDGGEDGLAAQIYADKYVNGKWQGAKLDVTNGGIYYTVGDKSFAERAVAENELVVKKDIAGLVGGMHFIGATTLGSGETYEQAIARLLTEKSHTAVAGDIVIVKSSDSDKEFIYDGSAWVELGDQGLYATVAQLEAEEDAREAADSAEAAARAAADDLKVTRLTTLSDNAKSYVSNNVGDDGACLKVEGTTNYSAVAVNNGGSGIGAQMYNWEMEGTNYKSGSVIDVTEGGIYYYNGDYTTSANRDVSANEIATIGDISSSVQSLTEAEIKDICK